MQLNASCILMTIAMLSLNGCQETQFEKENNSVASSNTEVSFTCQILSRVIEDTWEIEDNIGVFMFSSGTDLSDENIINNAANMKYTYTNESKFQPSTDNDRMYYPAKEAVDFIAYYPYKAVENYNINIDLTRQQDPAAIDLLYSNNLTNITTTNEAQTLTFKHKLSKLIFHIKNGEGMENEELEDISVLIKNIPSQTSFNLASETITPDETSTKDIQALVNETTAYAIVCPGESNGKEISVILPSGEFKFQTSNESMNWESGYQYTYSLILNKNNNTPTLEAEIEPWIDGKGEDLENSENDDIALVWDGQTADTNWYNNTDTEFVLSNANELAGLAELVNAGNDFNGKSITLTKDLNLNNHHFTTIGNKEYPFAGTFNGNQKQIFGYNPQQTEENYIVSLFGANKGTIKNIIITGSGEIDYQGTKSFNVGNIVGYNENIVEGCRSYVKVKLAVTGSNDIEIALGGIVGVNTGNISNCQNYGVLEYTTDNELATTFMGGIVGLQKNGTISQCENNQNLKAKGSTISLGGICGERYLNSDEEEKITSSILTCNNYGDITISEITDKGFTGGIIGRVNNWTDINSCNNLGNISAASTAEESIVYAGGIAGRATRCTFRNSQNNGHIQSISDTSTNYICGGGICAYLTADSEIHTSTHTTEATVTSSGYQGGICGYLSTSKEHVIVYGCNYNLGTPKKWIGSAKGNNYTDGVNQETHEDE